MERMINLFIEQYSYFKNNLLILVIFHIISLTSCTDFFSKITIAIEHIFNFYQLVVVVMSYLWNTCFYVWQGLYEYVRPTWEDRVYPDLGAVNLKTFGSTLPSRPTMENNLMSQLTVNGTAIPRYLIFHFIIYLFTFS